MRRELARCGPGATLGVTSLLHEACLDIAQREGMAFPDRARFLADAARVMRGLIIDGKDVGDAGPSSEAEEIGRLGQTLAAGLELLLGDVPTATSRAWRPWRCSRPRSWALSASLASAARRPSWRV